MRDFKTFVEFKDIFGFERHQPKLFDPGQPTIEPGDDPIQPLHTSLVTERLKSLKLGEISAYSRFNDEIQWGEGTGAFRIMMSPLGSFKGIIRRQIPDLEGTLTWICKKVIPFNSLEYGKKIMDERLAFEMFEMVEKMNQNGIEAPNPQYKDLEILVAKLISKVKANHPQIMKYEGAKKIRENNYVIYFSMRGQGVEKSKGSGPPGRVEQFVIDMSHNPHRGLIRSIGLDIQSPTRGHTWIPQPSEWDEWFSPAQSKEEIIDNILRAFSAY